MKLRYTLISDGSSDRALLPVLRWILVNRLPRSVAIEGRWADLRPLPSPPKRLEERIRATQELYPCDFMFVHRDAESVPLNQRKKEVLNAVALAQIDEGCCVAVVPVRMQEAWLLIDETAIRLAAGNPNGSIALDLPSVGNLEQLPDPKHVLHDLLERASGLGPRRRRRFNTAERALRVSQLIQDFEPLRGLTAFQELERDIDKAIASLSN